MNTKAAFDVACGSVPGRAHRRAGRGNQDAFAWRALPGAVVAAVCDGCGGGRHSEVGACLGARLWTTAIADRIAAGREIGDGALWLDVRDAVLARLGDLAAAMGGDLEGTVREHLLFTSVIAAWTDSSAVVAAIGDGVLAFDDDVTVVGPFEDNQPPYLGYGIVGPPPRFTVLSVRDARDVSSILIASDGAAAFCDGEGARVDAGGEAIGSLAQFASGERWFRNPDALRRRLAVINREEVGIDLGRGAVERRGVPLDDDTTIVVIRRCGGVS